VSFFHTETRRTGHEFQGMVTSTLKPLESQCSKDDVFVNTFHQTRNYTDQWGNLNFIIRMKKLDDDDVEMAPTVAPAPVAQTVAVPAPVAVPTPLSSTTPSVPLVAPSTTSAPVAVVSAAS
jgi:hypothetical protein